jgi:hypothetical protein
MRSFKLGYAESNDSAQRFTGRIDAPAMTEVTLGDQRPKLSGGGTADAAVPGTLGGQTVTLNGGGQVTSLNGVTFGYNSAGRIKSSTFTATLNSVTDTLGYDSFLRRVARTHTETSPAPASVTQEFYVYEGANVVATLDTSQEKLKDAYLFDATDDPLWLSHKIGHVCETPDGGTTDGSGGAGSVCLPIVPSYFYEIDLAGNVRRLRDDLGQ